MSEPIPTPRSDAQIDKENPIGAWGDSSRISTCFARQLEREVHILEAALKATKGKRMGHVEDIVKKALREVERMRKL